MRTTVSITWKKLIGFAACSVAAAAMLSTASPARAQSTPDAPPAPPGPNVFYRRMGPGPGVPGEEAMGFVGFEAGLGGEKTVTGAPFTATFSQETSHALADGNHIRRTTGGTLARDSNGRSRRDLTLPAIGDWATSGKTPPHVVLIKDPVGGSNYILEPDQKIARKLPTFANRFPKGPGGPPSGFAPDDSTTTSLGTQMVNGVSAQGTLTTRTIPAGAIGNDKPIVITVERWYSPDLQMNVMIKRSDPRTGDNVFQLANIVRSEPDAALFQVPADYTVKEGGKMGFAHKGHLPPPPPQN
jgi:hypothetical protein